MQAEGLHNSEWTRRTFRGQARRERSKTYDDSNGCARAAKKFGFDTELGAMKHTPCENDEHSSGVISRGQIFFDKVELVAHCAIANLKIRRRVSLSREEI